MRPVNAPQFRNLIVALVWGPIEVIFTFYAGASFNSGPFRAREEKELFIQFPTHSHLKFPSILKSFHEPLSHSLLICFFHSTLISWISLTRQLTLIQAQKGKELFRINGTEIQVLGSWRIRNLNLFLCVGRMVNAWNCSFETTKKTERMERNPLQAVWSIDTIIFFSTLSLQNNTLDALLAVD